MKRILALVSFVLISIGFALAQPPALRSKQVGSSEDEAAIRTIINHWQQNWINLMLPSWKEAMQKTLIG